MLNKFVKIQLLAFVMTGFSGKTNCNCISDMVTIVKHANYGFSGNDSDI